VGLFEEDVTRHGGIYAAAVNTVEGISGRIGAKLAGELALSQKHYRMWLRGQSDRQKQQGCHSYQYSGHLSSFSYQNNSNLFRAFASNGFPQIRQNIST